MGKRILETLKCTSFILLILLLTGALSVWYLYSTADMKVPDYKPQNKYHVTDDDIIRRYGPNMLRKGSSGLWELHIEGDAFERGEAIGKLSKDLLLYQEKAFFDQVRNRIPSDNYLRFLRFFNVLFNRNMGKKMPEEYRNEIYGISLSCTHALDFMGTAYERQLSYHATDALKKVKQNHTNSSSFAAWEENSADSSLIIGHNSDFYISEDFSRNKQVAFYRPETGYKFISVGWPGMAGVLSGMNEHGLTVTTIPVSILTREILQYATNIEEAYEIACSRKTFIIESILIGSAKDRKAAIIEKSPDKIALYTADDKKQLIDSPDRFAQLEELLDENCPVTPKRAASILRDYKVNQPTTHHSVIFKPEERLMWVSSQPWQRGKFVCFDLNEIFNSPPCIPCGTETLWRTIL